MGICRSSTGLLKKGMRFTAALPHQLLCPACRDRCCALASRLPCRDHVAQCDRYERCEPALHVPTAADATLYRVRGCGLQGAPLPRTTGANDGVPSPG